jgi:hypothetical protein
MNSAAQPEPHGTSTAGGWPIGSTPETNTTEVTTGSGPAHEWQSRLGSSRLARRVGAVSDVRARRIAALLLLVAFALVIVAQWKPWFSLNALGLDFGNSTRELRTIGAIDALYTLAIPYYLGWTVIVMSAGAAIFGSLRARRTSAAIAAGAVAGQALVVLATWHDSGVGVFREFTSPDGALRSSRASGIYFALAAVVVAAVALIVAVRGRILPVADEDVPPAPAPSVAEETHMPAPRMGVRAGTPWVDAGEDLGEDPAGGPVAGESATAARYAERADHSMYMRPGSATINSPR